MRLPKYAKRRLFQVALVLMLVSVGDPAAFEAAADKGVTLTLAIPGGEGGQRAVWTADGIYIEAQPLPGEGLLAFSRRLCGSETAASAIAQAHGGRRGMLAGAWYRIPVDWLSPVHQQVVMTTLFPGDQRSSAGWRHRVSQRDDTLWAISERFTGRGELFPELRRANQLTDNTIRPGQRLLIPAALLRPELRAMLPQVPGAAIGAGGAGGATMAPSQGGGVTTPTSASPSTRPSIGSSTGLSTGASNSAAGAAPAASSVTTAPFSVEATTAQRFPSLGDVRLEYGSDRDGDFALYRLKPGEALYSSVVVRFTGRVYANDVNALAADIARRSGVADVTDMAVGYPVKIPFALLQPEFLPPGHPRRQEFEQNQRASAAFSNTVRSRNLQGITVILDPGHGGNDVGASRRGVWESVYVYDIALRLKRHLETTTSARVFLSTEAKGGTEVGERDVLPYDKTHRVLTDPPYSLNQDSTVGVHLRWYLSNRIYREALERGAQSDHVVFLSIHADSLHPSLRGAMAYIPDAKLRRSSYSKSGSVYRARREVREQPRVTFTREEMVRSEGLSRQLATEIIDAFSRAGLAVHPEQPVRQKIYRGRKPWVPAVLRYNRVPASMLFEVSNLANDEDRRLLQTRRFRETAAVAIADGLLRYYGVDSRSAPPPQRIAAEE
ncbi:MAG: N-acetylmuramoyl-L-alanine amidase [Acidobacteriota bacterium]